MFRLGFPERASGLHIGYHFARPQSRCIYVGNGLLGGTLLFVVGIKKSRAVASSAIIPCPIERGWIMNLEKKLQQLSIAQLSRIENDLDRSAVVAMIPISCIGNLAAL